MNQPNTLKIDDIEYVRTDSIKKELAEKVPFIKDPIVQELIGNPDVEYTCGVICLDGEIKQTIALRRELKDGNTQTAYFEKDIGIID